MSMAKISKSDRAPADAMRVSLGAVTFELPDASSVYETNDVAVIANAKATPSLKVVEDTTAAISTERPVDMLDPHQNPAADHLSAHASDSAISAAASNEADIKEATGGDILVPDNAPTIQQTMEATFALSGVTGAPSFAQITPTAAPQPPAAPAAISSTPIEVTK